MIYFGAARCIVDQSLASWFWSHCGRRQSLAYDWTRSHIRSIKQTFGFQPRSTSIVLVVIRRVCASFGTLFMLGHWACLRSATVSLRRAFRVQDRSATLPSASIAHPSLRHRSCARHGAQGKTRDPFATGQALAARGARASHQRPVGGNRQEPQAVP